MNEIGYGALWLALLAAAFGTGCATFGGAFSRAPLVTRAGQLFAVAAGLLVTAVVALGRALIVSDLSLRYVASYSALNLPRLYKIVALWAGPPGTLLLWAALLAVVIALGARQLRRADLQLAAAAGATLGAVLLFSIALAVFEANPFALLSPAPDEGLGLSPQLQTVTAAIVSPLLLLGMACATVGVTTAAVALFQHREWRSWIPDVQKWAAPALVALTAGLTAGAVSPVVAAGNRSGGWGALEFGALGFCALSVFALAAGRSDAVKSRTQRVGRAALAAGLALFALLAAASLLRTSRDATIRDGETVSMKDPFGRTWTFASQGMSRFRRPPNQYVYSVSLMPRVGGARRALLTSEQRDYVNSRDQSLFKPMYFAGTQLGWLEDVRFTIAELRGDAIKIQIEFQPLMAWRWVAALLVCAGALLVLVRRAPFANAPSSANAEELDAAAEAAVERWRAQQTTCGDCGATSGAGARFCSDCGRSLTA